MVGVGRVAGGGAYAVVLLGYQLCVGERLSRRVPPELAAHPLVQALGEGLGETVGQCLGEDALVVVPGGLEAGAEFGHAFPRGDHEGADVVADAGAGGGDEIGQGDVRAAAGLLELLAEAGEDGEALAAGLVGVEHDVVAVGVRGVQTDDSPGGEQALAADAAEQGEGVLVETGGFRADFRVRKDVGILALEVPCPEEGGPVHAPGEFVEVVGAGDGGLGGGGRAVAAGDGAVAAGGGARGAGERIGGHAGIGLAGRYP